jgi:hypothetical protein
MILPLSGPNLALSLWVDSLAGIGTVIPGVGVIISLEQGELICCPPAPIIGSPSAALR